MSRNTDTTEPRGISMLGFTLIRTRNLRKALRAPPAPAPRHPGPAADEPPTVVHELIRLADRLPDLTGENAPKDSEQAAEIGRWLEGRTQALLTACDVTQVEDSGPLDLCRHEVVGTRVTSVKDLVHHIADTVRPGYTWQGRMLRPQQVVAYIAATGDSK